MSTPSPRADRGIRLLLLHAGEDHPKACTGKRLLRLGRVHAVARIPRSPFEPVVLDPHARRPLSVEDRTAAEVGGVLAVDCSWNRVAGRGGLPDRVPGASERGIRRRLPILLAGNPQHYGRVAELNTVEALASALYLLGDPERALWLLGGFRGGIGFLGLNRERLERYASQSSAAGVLAEERRLFSVSPGPVDAGTEPRS